MEHLLLKEQAERAAWRRFESGLSVSEGELWGRRGQTVQQGLWREQGEMASSLKRGDEA